jgi:transposase
VAERLFSPEWARSALTFIAGLRNDQIVAPWVIDGPINGEAFNMWVTQCLVPVLRPRDVVVLDNLSSHKNKTARQAVRKASARLFILHPYSPDLNPIEMMFAKLKTLMRKAEERTVEACWKRVCKVLKTFSPIECSNHLRHARCVSNLY